MQLHPTVHSFILFVPRFATDLGLSFSVKGVPDPEFTETSVVEGRFVSTKSRSSSSTTWTRTYNNRM